MIFSVIGGDERQILTAKNLLNLGHEVYLFGLPESDGMQNADSVCSAVCKADAVILPVPCSKDGMTVTATLTNDVIFLEDIIGCGPKFFFGGMINKQLQNALYGKDIPFYDYFTDGALIYNNAVLTAEAAIGVAVTGTKRSVFGSKALVIGYGRIGERLAGYLKNFGADVTAASRSGATLAKISADGMTAIKTDEIKENPIDFDYIFNTAPAPLLDAKFFSRCKSTAFVCDLATNAGTDFAAAKKFGITAELFSRLPGKYSPDSASTFITAVICEHIKSYQKTEEQKCKE